LIVALAAAFVAAARPRQSTLTQRFAGHRAEYALLRDMILADGLVAVADCGASVAREAFVYRDPERLGIARERRSAYESLLLKVGCPTLSADGDKSVRFSLAAWGSANRGWRINLVWPKTPPKPLVPSLDGFSKKQGRSTWETAYSRIEGDWYLSIVW
jgi:hypothetical protein